MIGGWISDAFTGKRRAAILGLACATVAILLFSGVTSIPTLVGSIYDAPVRDVMLDAEISMGRISMGAEETAHLEQTLAASRADGALRRTVWRAYGLTTLAFYLSIALFAWSYGLLMPSLTTLIGVSYADEPGHREAGYTLFFMMLNLGFIVGALIAGSLLTRLGWRGALLSTSIMATLALLNLLRVGKRLEPGADGSAKTRAESEPFSWTLSRSERNRVVVIAVLSTCYLQFVAAFEQWGGSFSLYVQNNIDRVIGGFEVPTLWIHSSQSLFVILLGPAMIWMWARASTRYGAISARNKMAIGMLATAVAFICIAFSAAQSAADPGTKASLFWPLTYYWIVTIGQLVVIPVGNAFISKEAPERLVGTLMGLWMLFGGVGIWLSGQIGAPHPVVRSVRRLRQHRGRRGSHRAGDIRHPKLDEPTAGRAVYLMLGMLRSRPRGIFFSAS